MRIGVLALQGDFKEHIKILRKLTINAIEIRLPEELDNIDGLIIPGGESTTMVKFITESGMDKKIISRSKEGMAIYGSCAGAILLAKKVQGTNQQSLGLIDIIIKRNAYGSQVESFEVKILPSGWDHKILSIFIRAPQIVSYGPSVKVLAKHGKYPVFLTSKRIMATTFHPELTEDTSIHKYFLNLIES